MSKYRSQAEEAAPLAGVNIIPVIDSSLEHTRSNETVCYTVAIGLHILAILWNPAIMKSDFKPIHDFVSVEVVDSAGGSPAPAPEQKRSLLSSLKDMLLTPKTDQIAHVAPEPIRQVAAPTQPTLKEAARRPIAMPNFQPKQNDDL